MITVARVDPRDKQRMRQFIELPYTLYRNDPQWVPPLRWERKLFFSPQNPFMAHARVAYFLAYRENQPVGRVTAHTDQVYDRQHRCRQGFFGFFESEEDHSIARQLMVPAETWLNSRSVDSILGPFNFSANHEIGFLRKGSHRPPTFMMPHTKTYYPALLEPLGYAPEKILSAYWLEGVRQVPKYLHFAMRRLNRRLGSAVEVREINRKDIAPGLAIIQEIFNDAWADNWGFTPLTPAEVDHMARSMKLIYNRHLAIILYYKGIPAGMAISLPDINEVLHGIKAGRLSPVAVYKLLFGRRRIRSIRVLLMGVKTQYQGLGLDLYLYHHMFSKGLAQTAFRNVECSWILEENQLMKRILGQINMVRDKEYLIMKKKLG